LGLLGARVGQVLGGAIVVERVVLFGAAGAGSERAAARLQSGKAHPK
jgi:hypothetical protein